MSISFVGAGTVADGINPVVTVPAGVQAGNFLMIFTTSVVTTDTPAGWNLVTAQGTGQFITCFFKIATGSDASVTLGNADVRTRAVMLAYSGVVGVNVVGTYVDAPSNSGFSVTPPSQTTTASRAFVLNIYANNSITNGTTWLANPSTTVRVSAGSLSGRKGILIADELQITAGATTTRTATYSQPQFVQIAYSGVTISLAPLPIVLSGVTISGGVTILG
jgi:hypothetical protein